MEQQPRLLTIAGHISRLKTLARPEGHIRLSEDDGPPAREFLEDDYDEDHQGLDLTDGGISAEHVHEALGRTTGEMDGVQRGNDQPIRAT